MVRAFITFFALFLVTCYPARNRVPYIYPEKPQTFYDEIREKDKNRQEVLEDSRKIYESEKCIDVERCPAICRDIFSSSASIKDCTYLTEVQVKKIEEVHRILENPSRTRLEELSLYDLNVFLNISPRPFERIFRRTGTSNAKDILLWVATNEKVADIFEGEDGEFVVLESLLRELRSDSIDALKSTIDDGDTFQELALEQEPENKSALRWIHSFLESECSSRSRRRDREEEHCVLGHYCNIIKRFDDENSAKILEFSELVGLVENLIEDPIGNLEDRFEYIDDADDVIDLDRDICIPFCAQSGVSEC